jgi:3'(2'), 5'-bisphosphate nucleotidase
MLLFSLLCCLPVVQARDAFTNIAQRQRRRCSFGAALRHASTALLCELPVDFPRRDDCLVALEAVRKACRVTGKLQPERGGYDGAATTAATTTIATVSKLDSSPVTVADFCSQAIVLHHLHLAFCNDGFIAEESSQALQQDPALAQLVLTSCSLSMKESLEVIMTSIDLGKSYEHWDKSSNPRPRRVWCLDPIDGTKGFLRGRLDGGQYCVALALLEDGNPTIGVLGCPNLPASPTDINFHWKDDETCESNVDSRGCIFVASSTGGCYQLPLTSGAPAVKVNVSPNGDDGSIVNTTTTTAQGRFCLGVEEFSDALGQCAAVARVFQGDASKGEGNGNIAVQAPLRIDSQAKYGVLARAGAEYYMRLPKPGYVEWIWDHAAGSVVIAEAGGAMTDTEGRPIDFSLGARMSDKVKGVLGSSGGKFHKALLDALHLVQQSSRTV